MPTPVKYLDLPDYASRTNGDAHPLTKVGVEDVEVYRQDFNRERVLTTQSTYIQLEKTLGAHMSRLVELLVAQEDIPIHLDDALLKDIAGSHKSPIAYWECKWKNLHRLDEENDSERLPIDCKLEGLLGTNRTSKWYLTLVIPYTAVCPCSAEMTREHGGIPHMQRATATITCELHRRDSLDVILTSTVAKAADVLALLPQVVLKREGELEWCQRAQEVNLFVEDAARNLAEEFQGFFSDFTVACKHFESIHTHNVVAVYRRGKRLL